MRDYRYDTFLKDYTTEEEAKIYFNNYINSAVEENLLLFLIGALLWLKAVMQLRFLEMSGN